MDGVREEAAEFRRDDLLTGLNRFRRVAGVGPVYEVVEVGPERVKIRMIDEDEIIEVRRREVELDPLA